MGSFCVFQLIQLKTVFNTTKAPGSLSVHCFVLVLCGCDSCFSRTWNKGVFYPNNSLVWVIRLVVKVCGRQERMWSLAGLTHFLCFGPENATGGVVGPAASSRPPPGQTALRWELVWCDDRLDVRLCLVVCLFLVCPFCLSYLWTLFGNQEPAKSWASWSFWGFCSVSFCVRC